MERAFEGEVAGLQGAGAELVAGRCGAPARVLGFEVFRELRGAQRFLVLPEDTLLGAACVVHRPSADGEQQCARTDGHGDHGKSCAEGHGAFPWHCACRRRRSCQSPPQILLPGAEQSVLPAYFQPRMASHAPA
ncbi:hypothetical protein FQZ97_1047710 [compost metagenome]